MWSLTSGWCQSPIWGHKGQFETTNIFKYEWNLPPKESRDLIAVSLQILSKALEFPLTFPHWAVLALRTCVSVGELRVEVLFRRLWRRQLLLQTESRHQLLKENTRPVAVAAQAAHDVVGRPTCTQRGGQLREEEPHWHQTPTTCVWICSPTTLKYWSNRPTLTDSRSDSRMDKQQQKHTFWSPESIESNTGRQRWNS